MTRFTKTLIAATALITFAGTAHAGDTFKVSFNYDETASIEANYAAFETKASNVCRTQIRKNGHRSIGYSKPLENSCEQELVEKAVAATKNTVLIAYHKEQTNPNAAPTQLASNK